MGGYRAPILTGLAPPLLIGPADVEFAVSRILRRTNGQAAAYTATTNAPIVLEFWIRQQITVFQLGWRNGSGTMTDTCELAIYDDAGNRKVTTGTTTRTGVSTQQFVNVADTVLDPGCYRAVYVNHGATANNPSGWDTPFENATTAQMFGMLGTTATYSGALPNPLTDIVAGTAVPNVIPVIYIVTRALA